LRAALPCGSFSDQRPDRPAIRETSVQNSNQNWNQEDGVLLSKRLARAVAFAALLALPGQSARAGTELRIDMGLFAPATPGNWNNLDNAALTSTTSGLIDFHTGLASPISLSGTGWEFFIGVENINDWPTKAWVPASAVEQGAGVRFGLSGNFIFAGLKSSDTYTVEIVSARTVFNYLNTITIDSVLANRTENGTPVATPWGSNANGLLAQNWLIWDGLRPVAGALTIALTANVDTLGMLNAIRLIDTTATVPVPEPASGGLLGAGLIALALQRWRRRPDREA
jgi:hypothetical protein